MSYQPKVALVHDDFTQAGGAENLFAQIAQIYPQAPIYTAFVNWNKLPISISQNRVRPSFMQKIPFASKFFKLLLPLHPLAFESFDFSKFDVVISSTTRFSKVIVTKPNTIHICYINSTPRFLWHENSKRLYLKNWQKKLFNPILIWLKRYDHAASGRPDCYIANSKNVAFQVQKNYDRRSAVVYPFADTDFFIPRKSNQQSTINYQLSYYLVVSRLVKWKRIDLTIKACLALGKNLIIVGTGPDEKRLRKLAQSTINNQQSTIEFEGRIPREELREFYQNAQALIVTQEEDFGISTVEAQACGIPVIAFSGGGQKEIIKDKKTGILFKRQSTSSLEDAIRLSLELEWNSGEIRKNALKFSKTHFVKNLKAKIKEYARK